MSTAEAKIQLLRSYLSGDDIPYGAILVIYPPEEELTFRSGYEEIIRELQARIVPFSVLDFRTTVFDALANRKLLDRAFKLDAKGDLGARKSLSTIVQKEVLERIRTAAEDSPNSILLCKNTGALFPWVSFSSLLKAIEGKTENPLIIPFPGTESGPSLHFLAAKDGYDYRAMRV